MRSRPSRIVVTGAEGTGKTTLAGELSEHFGVPMSPEFARSYVELVGRALTKPDVEAIARGQMAGEDAACAAATSFAVIHDTDLVSTVTYARYYYGECPSWIERAAEERRGDLYLFLHDDVPWVPDGFQRDSVEARAEVARLLERALRDLGVEIVEIAGDWDTRRAAAVAAVAAADRAEPDLPRR